MSSCSREPTPTDGGTIVKEARSGEVIYKKYCSNCHQGGLVNSPVLGKIEDWEDRLEAGREALVESVRTGIPPGMPKMGSCRNCTDEELENAVDYMLSALDEEEQTE